MKCRLSKFIAIRCHRIAVASGLLVFFLAFFFAPALAQDQMMRRGGGDHGGDHGGGHGGALRSIGTGIAVDVLTGVIVNELNKPGTTQNSHKAAKKAKTEKKIAKKPPKDDDRPLNAKKPDTPPAKQADTPEKPPAAPTPPVAGPGPTPQPGSPSDQPPGQGQAGPPGGGQAGPPGGGTAEPPGGGQQAGPPGGGTGGPPDGGQDGPPGQTTTTTTDGGTTTGGNPPGQTTTSNTGIPPHSHPRVTGRRDDYCPQRGMGCAVLIIDYSRWVSYENDLDSLSQKFKAVCGEDNVIYVAPKVQALPEEKDFPSNKDWVAALFKTREHNKAELTAINAAIDKHRAAVKAGVELAVEMLNGHGTGDRELHGVGCGFVGPDENSEDISRAEFHRGNYEAAYDNTCNWFVADFSCYSGKTAYAIDELNNTAKATCRAPVGANNCSEHAAYEYDIGFGTATAKATCRDFTVGRDAANIYNALDAEISRRAASNIPAGKPSTSLSDLMENFQDKTATFGDWGSKYVDHGYKHCTREFWELNGYP